MPMHVHTTAATAPGLWVELLAGALTRAVLGAAGVAVASLAAWKSVPGPVALVRTLGVGTATLLAVTVALAAHVLTATARDLPAAFASFSRAPSSRRPETNEARHRRATADLLSAGI